MTFQEKLSNLKDRLEGKIPEDKLKIMHQATEDLKQSGLKNSVLGENEPAPSFSLVNQNGVPISSKDLLKKGPLVLTFYRGVWCPYCNLDLANLNHYEAEIHDLGAQMVAISPEKPSYLKEIIETQRLRFDILHDKDNELAKAFQLAFTLPADLIEVYKAFNINLPEHQGNEDWMLPMPARFVIDQRGTIRYAESEEDYRQRPDPDELMSALKKL
ncbi:peroxiredoxin-like family protein [Persicobacter psychrovividus]|uniref:thioredoxin-dependent peroxiredoxin n=1 Tax=Persicobacter psychrovividus TaxID=387638 RepID=A0ABM7VCZ3_9BACT|nr:peroxiredoxin [Persicobacter psychrovividus]